MTSQWLCNDYPMLLTGRTWSCHITCATKQWGETSSICLTFPIKDYSQFNTEALALIYGVNKCFKPTCTAEIHFDKYISYLWVSWDQKKGISSVAAARLQRWAILNVKLWHWGMGDHCTWECWCPLPTCLPQTGPEYVSEVQMCNLQQLKMLPVMSQEIRRATQRDPLLGKKRESTLSKDGQPMAIIWQQV